MGNQTQGPTPLPLCFKIYNTPYLLPGPPSSEGAGRDETSRCPSEQVILVKVNILTVIFISQESIINNSSTNGHEKYIPIQEMVSTLHVRNNNNFFLKE